jgi:hypothetical protein
MKNFICDCCGQEFFSEYWIGGYIDHTNLCNNRKVFKSRFENGRYKDSFNSDNSYNLMIKDIVHELCYHGNDKRDEFDIRKRLMCFKTWDEYDNQLKIDVETSANLLINERNLAYKKIETFLKSLSNIELNMLESMQLNLYYK